jgi:acyl dehydratase
MPAEASVNAAPREFRSADDLLGAVGQELGTSPWVRIDQARIDAFADVTDDHQWIHTDPARAADGPFGATIAHGLLTLALVPSFVGQIFRVSGAKMAINYGSDRVRYISPVKVDSRIRASSMLKAATVVDSGAHPVVQATYVTTIEIEGSAKPAAVVEHLGRYYF